MSGHRTTSLTDLYAARSQPASTPAGNAILQRKVAHIAQTADSLTAAHGRMSLLRETFEHNLSSPSARYKAWQYVNAALPRKVGPHEEGCPASGKCTPAHTAELPRPTDGHSCLIILCGLLRYCGPNRTRTHCRIRAASAWAQLLPCTVPGAVGMRKDPMRKDPHEEGSHEEGSTRASHEAGLEPLRQYLPVCA
jgi:hypothetical protein